MFLLVGQEASPPSPADNAPPPESPPPAADGAAPASPAPAEGGADDAAPAAPPAAPPALRIDLETFVQRFMAQQLDLIAAEQQVARAGAQQGVAGARFRVDWNGDVPAGYRFRLLGGNAVTPFHEGAIAPAGTGLTVDDPLGGRTSLYADGVLTTSPTIPFNQGQAGAVRAEYALPLWRNLIGALYLLEQRSAEQGFVAADQRKKAVTVTRCAAGVGTFLEVEAFEEMDQIWQDLLARKEQVLKQTQRDYGRRLVTRLDWLSAQSDWEQSQQRYRDFQIQRRQRVQGLLAVLDDPAARKATLDTVQVRAAPGASSPDAPAPVDDWLAAHPAMAALDALSSQIDVEVERQKRSIAPEVFLVPEVGSGVQSHNKLAGGGGAVYVDAYAQMSVRWQFPVFVQRQRHDLAALYADRTRVDREKQSLRLALLADAARWEAEAARYEAQRVQSDTRVTLAQQQIREARGMFGQGRLEFQDFLQHWDVYETARLSQVSFRLQRDLAVLRRYSAQGRLVPVCAPKTTRFDEDTP